MRFPVSYLFFCYCVKNTLTVITEGRKDLFQPVALESISVGKIGRQAGKTWWWWGQEADSAFTLRRQNITRSGAGLQNLINMRFMFGDGTS